MRIAKPYNAITYLIPYNLSGPMTTILLIRHALNDSVGQYIAGCLPGVHLNPAGCAQAKQLAERLAEIPITAIYSSPLERTQETAAPLARRLGLSVHSCEALIEVGLGDWQGMSFADVDSLPTWRRFNSFRAGTRIPNGESILEVQARVIGVLEHVQRAHPDQIVALVSHGDPIKTALTYFAGIPLDLMLRLEISPASVSILTLDADGAQILCINHTGALAGLLNA